MHKAFGIDMFTKNPADRNFPKKVNALIHRVFGNYWRMATKFAEYSTSKFFKFTKIKGLNY